MDRATAF